MGVMKVRHIDLRESAQMHRELYRAIRARDAGEARRLMEKHLRMAQTAQGMERPAKKDLSPARQR